MRIVGPNSLGIIVPDIGLNASQAVAAAKPGHLAFISQSHSLSNAILDWAADTGVGFSLFASLGNNLDIGYGDLIDYLGTDPNTRAIILYVQSIEHARRFMSAARSFACTKPIVAYKSGRFEGSARAALSHTGAIAGEDAVYSAVFERAGVVRVAELDDIFDVAEILASQRLPEGSRLAIVGNAGGPAIIAADALLARKGELAMLGDETVEQLNRVLPGGWSHGNPVDLLDAAGAGTLCRGARNRAPGPQRRRHHGDLRQSALGRFAGPWPRSWSRRAEQRANRCSPPGWAAPGRGRRSAI